MTVTGCVDEITQLAELETLLDASLIEPVDQAAGTWRFRMLETIRDFGAEALSTSGEATLRRDLHADHVATLVGLAEPHLLGPDQGRWLDTLDADRDNITSAASWLLATGRVNQAARIAIAAWRFWHLRSHLQEGRDICQAVLQAGAGAALEPSLRPELLSALGGLTYWHRDYAEAHRLYQQARDVSVVDDNRTSVAAARYNLGFTAFYTGRISEAEDHFSRALEEYTALRDRLGWANALAGLAVVDRAVGDHDRARQRAYEAMAVQQKCGDQFSAVNTLGLIGSIEAHGGDTAVAEDLLKQALRAHDRVANTSGIVWMLHELAATACANGSTGRAVILSTAAASMEGDTGSGVGSDVLGLSEPVAAAIAQLGAGGALRQQTIGQNLTRQDAIAFALSDDPAPGVHPGAPRRPLHTGA
jgi:non-specific serine/threonine protein kinase